MTHALTTPQPTRHPSPTAKASQLAYLVFERPDLDRAEAFFGDFGLHRAARMADVLYLRSNAPEAYCLRVHRAPRARFVGAGFRVETAAELDHIARLDGAAARTTSQHPGGGDVVSIRDPAGFLVEVVHARAPGEALPARAPLEQNVGHERRRVNVGQRPPVEPPQLLGLGHFVLEVADYQATSAWYTQSLGLIPSDVQVFDDGSPAVTFFRLDRGEVPSDHHTLALAQGFMPRFGHAAFEVVDADAIGMGQRVLRERGWRHAWGIGRHILGSQLFDYWNDPWGDRFEHYCDGDVFTADRPPGVHPVSREAMAQWGPPMPRSFTSPALGPAELAAIARNLGTSPDLTVSKLRTLAKLFG